MIIKISKKNVLSDNILSKQNFTLFPDLSQTIRKYVTKITLGLKKKFINLS